MSQYFTRRSVTRYALLICGWCLVVVLGVLAGEVVAGTVEEVSVDGSHTKYPATISSKIGDKDVSLVLTGAAMRKKAIFKVYTIGSYLEKGVQVHSAAELAAKDCAKQLHLVMERDVDGKEMAEAFIEAVRLNYAAPKFAEECKSLLEFMQAHSLKTGDHILFTHIPTVGLRCEVGGSDVLVKSVAFAQAVWEIYLGDKNVGEAIKTALTSRLKD